MQEKSSVNQSLTTGGKVLLLLLNFTPLVHIAACVAAVLFLPVDSAWAKIGVGAAMLYLAPALLARVLKIGCTGHTHSPIGSRAFFFWWATMQCQMLFGRLPILEEMLRLVPGLYSLWLRLWGSQIGRLTFWAPGTVILDRGFLHLGDDVVLGAGVRFNPHVIRKNKAGEPELQLAPIRLGDRVSVGGYSLLTAGTVIPDDETTRAYLLSPPFSEWKNGKRIKR
ncbi:hypothetical protein NT6N_12050 [Oceaniferula spumae]|uniref:Acyl transferase n=1 Tax=Oceaniferula spumae TaxID=2979115 RepID=A0AAT9FJQ5_9BACT